MTVHVPAFDPATVDFDVFALFLEARRLHRKKTPLRVAREAEVGLDAVFRASRGRNPGAVEFFALCDWIGEEPELFLKRELRGFSASRAVPEASPPGAPARRETVRGDRSVARPAVGDGK